MNTATDNYKSTTKGKRHNKKYKKDRKLITKKRIEK